MESTLNGQIQCYVKHNMCTFHYSLTKRQICLKIRHEIEKIKKHEMECAQCENEDHWVCHVDFHFKKAIAFLREESYGYGWNLQR